MSEYTYNAGITSTYSGDVTIHCTAPVYFDKIELYAKSTLATNSTSSSAFTITISDSVNSVTCTKKEVTNGNAGRYKVNLGFTSTTNTDVKISISRENCTLYGGSVSDDEKYISGTGAYFTTAVWDCVLILNAVELVWSTSEGSYPTLTSNTYNPWTDWQRDEETGYPLNWSVWKIDENINRGYPFIWYSESDIVAKSNVYFKTNTQLLKCNVYQKTTTGLAPVTLTIKGGK